MSYTEILIIAILLFVLFAFYAIGLYFNKKTPLPQGCDLPSLKCEHCSATSCSYSKVNRVQEIKKEIKANFNNNSGEGVSNE